MTATLNALELSARTAWRAWSEYRGYHQCDGCGEHRYCGRSARTRRWLCLDCWSLGGAAVPPTRRRAAA